MSGRGRGGRGAYYKAKYGRGGQRSHENTSTSIPTSAAPSQISAQGGKEWKALAEKIGSISNKPYPFYKDLLGGWNNEQSDFTLYVDHVQADPYAPPSRVRVKSSIDNTSIPVEFFETETRRIALADYLTRRTAGYIEQQGLNDELGGGDRSGWSGPKGGAFNINAPAQEVLERTSCVIDTVSSTIELRFTVKLPARGRTILSHEAAAILVDSVPELVRICLKHSNLDPSKLETHITCVEEQEYLRSQLQSKKLVAFIANGSVLPRQSGAVSLPMNGKSVVPFKSPKAFEVVLEGLDESLVVGMGIPRGVTVLTGGGFHGKSTVLEAIQAGVYNHIPGDGREKVVTDLTAVKIRAEDGRYVSGLDITPFISDLPGKKSTKMFTSADASGSSSMASNIQESLELGCTLLLIDEDTSATNLLIRDERMRQLIRDEPITPFVSRVRALFNERGVSTIIVIGGCGDYLSVADQVIGMSNWLPKDLTQTAKEIVANDPNSVQQLDKYGQVPDRRLNTPSDSITLVAKGISFIETRTSAKRNAPSPSEGKSGIDLTGIEQLVEVGQVRFIAEALQRIGSSSSTSTISDALDDLDNFIRTDGLTAAHKQHWLVGDLVRARKFEVGAALNRLRLLSAEEMDRH